MRILVYGAGAVGCYLGAHLALAGHTITLLGRERVAHAIHNAGLILRRPVQSHGIRAPHIHTETDLRASLESEPDIDLVLLTTKAYDTFAALDDLAVHLKPAKPVISVQNGVGTEDAIRATLGTENVVIASLTSAVSMEIPGQVIEEKQRGLALASDSAAYPTAISAFRPTHLNLQTCPDWQTLRWSKLLLNILCNATCAILDMTPQAVLGDPRLFGIEIRALKEALSVLRLKRIRVTNLPGAPAASLQAALSLVPWPLLRPLLRPRLASGRGDKLPSLMTALRRRQSRTEVAWLNGAVAEAARSQNRLAPINHALALLVSDIASGRIAPDLYRNQPDLLVATLRIADGDRRWRYGE